MSETLPVIVAVVVVAAVTVSVQTRLAAVHRRLDRLSGIHGKLDALLKHSGIRYDPFQELPAPVLEALKAGRKIDAIKQYRHATGAGLAEAKDMVEEAMRRGAVR